MEVDKVIYINLDHRTDRKELIENTLKEVPFKNVQRFSAIKDDIGTIGCVKSHIKCLEIAIQENLKNILIMEDDNVWFNDYKNKLKILEEKLSNQYDVIVLSGTWPYYDEKSLKLFKCGGTGAYIVNQKYFYTLLNNFKEGLEKLKLFHKETEEYNIDLYWNRLQARDNWYIVQLLYTPTMFSDIKNRIMDYSRVYKNLYNPKLNLIKRLFRFT
jgi:glycosyl transferase family 25